MAPVIAGAQWDIHASGEVAAALVAAIGKAPPIPGRVGDVRFDVWTACAPLARGPHRQEAVGRGCVTYGTAMMHTRASPEHLTPFGVYLFDEASSSGCLMLQKSHGMQALFGTNVLLPAITWWAGSRGLVPLHAAALGSQGRYWLIPAASGSGKSVACVAGRAAGLSSLGDDVVLWDPAAGTVHTVYDTVRLTPHGLALAQAHLDRAGLLHEGFRQDGKALLVSREPGPRSGSLAGILMLGTTHGTPAAAHTHLLSSLSMGVSMGSEPRALSRDLARLSRTAEVRALHLDDDLDRWGQALVEVTGAA